MPLKGIGSTVAVMVVSPLRPGNSRGGNTSRAKAHRFYDDGGFTPAAVG